MTTNPAPESPFGRPAPRSFQMRAEVRLFHTNQDLACQEDPELFFDPATKRSAINQCADCPFRGRCGYNAVAMGATFGIWGGVNLPGDVPSRLKPVYARLARQFEERRRTELGDAPVAPLPDPDADADDDAPRAAHRSTPQAGPPSRHAGFVPSQWALNNSRIA
jgi:WhiB family transcriptional regulator, redox-sensing transcriptional regulator